MQFLALPLKLNLWKVFILLSVLSLISILSIDFLFLSDGLFYQSFEERMAFDRIAQYIEFFKKFRMIGHALVPVIVFFRVSFVVCTIYIGCFFSELKVQINDLFRISLIAEFVFVVSGLSQLVILIFFKDVTTVNDIQFQPLSLMELMPKGSLKDTSFLIYPLSLLNVFELIHFFILAYLLDILIGKSFVKSLKIVVSSYGTGLLFWMLFVMFLTVNLS